MKKADKHFKFNGAYETHLMYEDDGYDVHHVELSFIDMNCQSIHLFLRVSDRTLTMIRNGSLSMRPIDLVYSEEVTKK